MSTRLKNKKILITGGSSGIGRKIAIEAASAGAVLIITGRNVSNLKETLKACSNPKEHLWIQADLTKEEDRKKLVESVDQLDGLVYSAGITEQMPVKYIREKHFRKIFDINFDAVVYVVSQLLKSKKIKMNASLLFLSSVAPKYPYYGGAVYSSSKSALESFAKVLALEVAEKKIRANCISPSFVETDLIRETEKRMSQETEENIKKIQPLGKGDVKDVADAALFFLSNESRWITGANLQMGSI